MRWIATLCVLASVLATEGCAHERRTSIDPLGAAPTDFALELSVLTGPAAPPSSDAHLRQSRYVLLADGSLYHGDDPARGRGADWLPPLTRVLTRRQQADVWALARHLGFTNPADARAGAVNFKRVSPGDDGLVYLAAFSGWGGRWTFVRPCDVANPDRAMAEFARELARLVWASDEPADAISVAPRRYDFGPDPYARFRQPGGAPAAEVAPSRNEGSKQ